MDRLAMPYHRREFPDMNFKVQLLQPLYLAAIIPCSHLVAIAAIAAIIPCIHSVADWTGYRRPTYQSDS